MDDENNIAKSKVEEKQWYEEDRFWCVEKNGLHIQTKSFNFEKYCADLWMEIQNEGAR